MKQKMWKTKTGKKIKIRDMSDSHLKNTVLMLRRNHSRETSEAYIFAGCLQGEMAQLDADNMIQRMEDEGPGFTNPIYDDLMEEVSRRGLEV